MTLKSVSTFIRELKKKDWKLWTTWGGGVSNFDSPYKILIHFRMPLNINEAVRHLSERTGSWKYLSVVKSWRFCWTTWHYGRKGCVLQKLLLFIWISYCWISGLEQGTGKQKIISNLVLFLNRNICSYFVFIVQWPSFVARMPAHKLAYTWLQRDRDRKRFIRAFYRYWLNTTRLITFWRTRILQNSPYLTMKNWKFYILILVERRCAMRTQKKRCGLIWKC